MSTTSPRPTRTLGIDFGERRIGLALSDPGGSYALPFTVLERETDRRAIYEIVAIARREDVGLLVLGEPRRPDGRPSSTWERVSRFGAKLMRASGLPLCWVEETLTTVEAAARLRRAGTDPDADLGRLDMVAAQILLQEALDGGGRREPPPPRGDERTRK